MVDSNIARKYSIFISSSFEDLQDARWGIVKEILRIGHIPLGMELFHAGDRRNLDVIQGHLAECDIVIVLVGARLGSEVSQADSTSFTDWEYEQAQKLGKPILAFLLDKNEYVSSRACIPHGDPERSNDGPLDAFRQKVERSQRIVEYFSYDNPGDLRSKVSNAVALEIQSLATPRGGWVPGVLYDALAERVMFDVAVSGNLFFRRYANRLNQFRTLSLRTKVEDKLKVSVARYFWRLYLPRISSKKMKSLFFESGSSIAYVSQEYIRILTREDWASHLTERIQISTNNILTFLDFILIDPPAKPFSVRLEPQGPVEEYYGATFGELTKASHLPAPRQPRPLHTDAIRHVAQMKKRVSTLISEDAGLILMAASGIELDVKSQFVGPHVGSYYNKLMKRSLLSAKRPTVLFLDEKKFPRRFRVGECYQVCGPDYDWETVRKEVPLAIAIATSTRRKMVQTCTDLNKLGFIFQQPIMEQDGVWPMIASNKAFHDFFYDPAFDGTSSVA